MATIKVTQFFNSNVGFLAGWTESFYTTQADTLTALQNLLAGYNQARRALLHADYSLLGSRAVDVAQPRVARYDYYAPASQSGRYPGSVRGDKGAEAPFDGVLISLTADGSDRKRGFILRGLPKDVIDDTYNYVGDDNAVWGPLILAYRGQILLVQGGPSNPLTKWLIRRDAASPAVGTTAMGTSAGGLALTFQPIAQTVPPIAVGDRLKVSGELNAAWVNGLWKARVVSVGPPLTIVTFPKRRPIRGAPTAVGDQVQQITVSYPPVIDAQIGRGAKRDTGRPFGLLRGKRPVQVG